MTDEERKREGDEADEALSSYFYYYGAAFPSATANKLFQAESNKEKVGDYSVGDVKLLIRELARHELRWGDLSPLNLKRRRFLAVTAFIILFLAVLGTVGYFIFREPTSTVKVWVRGDKINVVRSYNDFAGTRFNLEMRNYDNEWYMCPKTGGFSGCELVFTPFEVPSAISYDGRSKFIFTDKARVFWVDNDRMGVRALKFEQEQWWFEDENSVEGWTDFNTLNRLAFDAREQQRQDAR